MAGGGAGRAFIGSFTAAGGPGVVAAAVDPDSGALRLLGSADGVPDPSYLALAPDGDTLYAVSETSEGAVAAYSVTGGAPRLAGRPVPVGGGPTHLSLFDGHVLTANYGCGSITVVPVRADGTLAPAPSGRLRHTGSGLHTPRQRGPHAHQVQPDPSGRWVVSVDLGTDSVRVCTLADGTLALHREFALRPGSGPRHLAFHPNGRYAYVVNELTPTLTVCRWDAESGALRPLTETAVLPGVPDGDAYPSGIVVSSDGRFVWIATRGEDVLSVFAVEGQGQGQGQGEDPRGGDEGEGEGLRLVATVPCGGRWPRALAASGGFLYAANERSGDVTWFAVDPHTGIPRRGGSVRVTAASCVVFG